MSQQSITLLSLTVTAAGTVTGGRFVTHLGAQAGAAGNTLGVADYDAVAGELLSVTVMGTAVVEAGAAVSAGDAIETDADGCAITQTAGPVVARANQAATLAGEYIEVVLIPN